MKHGPRKEGKALAVRFVLEYVQEGFASQEFCKDKEGEAQHPAIEPEQEGRAGCCFQIWRWDWRP